MSSWFWRAPPTTSEQASTRSAPTELPSPPPGTTSACPVDDRTREAWLQKSRETGGQLPGWHPHSQVSRPTAALGEEREVSSIPRAFDSTVLPHSSQTPLEGSIQGGEHNREPSACPAHSGTSSPANSEDDTGHDRATGNWVYPSERQFFDAMARKNFEPRVGDMKSVVPIHNAVNERAWTMIRRWEEPYAEESRACGGPKLLSFKGLGAPRGGNDGTWAGWATLLADTNVSPRAKWKVLNGYKAPFDRHDWVVDRCGKRVDYVIDFYEGKGGGLLNFYLDVRPKLNSWEGWKMRAWSAFGDR